MVEKKKKKEKKRPARVRQGGREKGRDRFFIVNLNSAKEKRSQWKKMHDGLFPNRQRKRGKSGGKTGERRPPPNLSSRKTARKKGGKGSAVRRVEGTVLLFSLEKVKKGIGNQCNRRYWRRKIKKPFFPFLLPFRPGKGCFACIAEKGGRGKGGSSPFSVNGRREKKKRKRKRRKRRKKEKTGTMQPRPMYPSTSGRRFEEKKKKKLSTLSTPDEKARCRVYFSYAKEKGKGKGKEKKDRTQSILSFSPLKKKGQKRSVRGKKGREKKRECSPGRPGEREGPKSLGRETASGTFFLSIASKKKKELGKRGGEKKRRHRAPLVRGDRGRKESGPAAQKEGG